MIRGGYVKKVIFTVDVEGHDGSDPVEHLIYGNVGGEKCGIDLIMDLCDKYSVKGIFFVDIAEAFHYGKEKIADALLYAKDLKDRYSVLWLAYKYFSL